MRGQQWELAASVRTSQGKFSILVYLYPRNSHVEGPRDLVGDPKWYTCPAYSMSVNLKNSGGQVMNNNNMYKYSNVPINNIKENY